MVGVSQQDVLAILGEHVVLAAMLQNEAAKLKEQLVKVLQENEELKKRLEESQS